MSTAPVAAISAIRRSSQSVDRVELESQRREQLQSLADRVGAGRIGQMHRIDERDRTARTTEGVGQRPPGLTQREVQTALSNSH
ncbi:MAG: hypothetical protein ACLP0J_10230 [Solirubrobacteraceae bacterium]